MAYYYLKIDCIKLNKKRETNYNINKEAELTTQFWK